MKVVLFSLVIAVCCLTSCKTYMDYSSYPKMDDLKLGVNKEYVIEKWGQPFSFSSYVINNDTIVTLNYKTPDLPFTSPSDTHSTVEPSWPYGRLCKYFTILSAFTQFLYKFLKILAENRKICPAPRW